LAANPAACRLLGHTEEALRRLGRDGIVSPGDRARWDAALADRARTGSFRAELAFARGDGTAFDAEVTSTVCTDTGGQARAWLIVRDVGDQRAAEADLRASEQLLRRLIATSNDAFIAMDGDGHIREWNYQAEVLFG